MSPLHAISVMSFWGPSMSHFAQWREAVGASYRSYAIARPYDAQSIYSFHAATVAGPQKMRNPPLEQ